MKIAIHKSVGFSKRWIAYCEQNGIDYKIVNCYNSSIIKDLRDCSALMWHYHHEKYTDVLFAKQLLFALEHTGKTVFPDFRTSWHFDDKIAQKYLFEAFRIPTVPTYISYNKSEALDWAAKTDYPIVFKLRRGSASKSVRLIKNYNEAKKIVIKSFDSGHSLFNNWSNLRERVRRYRDGLDPWTGILKGVGRLIIKPSLSKDFPNESGYVYFQEFIPDNDSDIRVVVIRDKAFAIKRMVRRNDFRASGSGNIIYDKELIDEGVIKLSFQLADKLKSQCVAFDFVYSNQIPIILEISYGFSASGYDSCPGYWDKKMEWHEGEFNPYGWMVDLVINNNFQ